MVGEFEAFVEGGAIGEGLVYGGGGGSGGGGEQREGFGERREVGGEEGWREKRERERVRSEHEFSEHGMGWG